MLDANTLPDDVATLKRLVLERDREVELLKLQLAKLRRWKFGQSSESLKEAGQLPLRLEELKAAVMQAMLENAASPQPPAAESAGRNVIPLKKRPKRRKQLPEHFESIQNVIEPKECVCADKIRWLSGSQPYDANLLFSGTFVDKGYIPRRLIVEVTTSVHKNDYLARERLDKQGYAFGVKGLSRDKKTGDVTSEPHVVSHGERESDLASQIIDRVRAKGQEGYDPETVLIVYCVPNGVTLQDEWDQAVQLVRRADVHHAFREVFLIDTGMCSFSATLYGDTKRASNRSVGKRASRGAREA